MGRGSKGRNQRIRSAIIRREPSILATEPSASDNINSLTLSHTQTISTYSGPTPPVELLHGYENLVPGSAKQILDQFVKQSDHRMGLEKKVVSSDIVRSWAGLASGLIVALAFVACGTWLAFQGHDGAGVTIATTSIVGLVGVFVYGTVSQRKERTEKAALMLKTRRHS